jgi:hypothetical protein
VLLLITNLHWHCVPQIHQRMMIRPPGRPAGRAEPLPPAKPKYSYVRAQRCTTRWPLRPVLGTCVRRTVCRATWAAARGAGPCSFRRASPKRDMPPGQGIGCLTSRSASSSKQPKGSSSVGASRHALALGERPAGRGSTPWLARTGSPAAADRSSCRRSGGKKRGAPPCGG